MDYEKFLKDVKEGNAEDVKKDVEELQENLKELDTIGKLVDYLKTLDPNKKVLIGYRLFQFLIGNLKSHLYIIITGFVKISIC